jgi:hypothetical protein
MAQKRMFDRAIIDTDNFMDLPVSAKALYFLLGMEADDEGFCSYKKVLRVHGGTDDDVKVLIAKDFLIGFPSGVVVVVDWNFNNYLDKNKVRETSYKKEKTLLLLKNRRYALTPENIGVKLSLNQDRIGEDRIGEKRLQSGEAPIAEKSLILSGEWNLTAHIQDMIKNKQKHVRVLGQYFLFKNADFPTRKAFDVEFNKYLKPASQLAEYTGNQIQAVFEYLEDNEFWRNKWTLKTASDKIATYKA